MGIGLPNMFYSISNIKIILSLRIYSSKYSICSLKKMEHTLSEIGFLYLPLANGNLFDKVNVIESNQS